MSPWSAAAPVLTLLLMLAGGTAAAQSLPPSAEPSDGRTTIYVARRSWHVDVGFAAADVEPPLQLGLQALPGAAYVFFITNAVKHFKWEPRGKRRLHK
jgi:hypothetical protein